MQLHYNRVSSNHVYAHYFEKKFHVVLLSERKNIFTFFFSGFLRNQEMFIFMLLKIILGIATVWVHFCDLSVVCIA